MSKKSFADIFREAIETSGCTLGEISRRLRERGFRTNKGTLTRWKNGDNAPSFRNLEVLRYLPDAMDMSAAQKAAFLKAISVALGFTVAAVVEEEEVGWRETAVFPYRQHYGADTLSPFVGRKRELARLQKWVREYRSVVISGLGGIGKTRLAQELLRTAVSDFAHGCEYLELTANQDSLQVTRSIARLLGLDADSVKGKTSQTIFAQLRDRLQWVRLLFLVDNVEHVEQVRELVRELSAITWVFTTRNRDLEQLDVRALHLELPSHEEAMEIFRAHARRPALFSEENLPLLEQVIEPLGRLPLALRLVAGLLANEIIHDIQGLETWIVQGGLRKIHSPTTRLHRLFEQIVGTISPVAQQLFEMCGLFESTTIKVAALQAISQKVGLRPSLADWDMLSSYSLIAFPDDAQTQIELHPLLHDYARQRLAASPKQAVVWEAFKEHFLEVAEAISDAADDTQREYWPLLSIEQELLKVAGAFYQERDWLHLQRIWPTLSGYLWNTGNYAAYESFDRQCLEAMRATGDSYREAIILSELGYVKMVAGEWDEVEALFQLSQAIHDRSADQLVEQARLRRYRAHVATSRGEYETAVALLDEAEARLTQLTNPPETRLTAAWIWFYTAKMIVYATFGELEKAASAGEMANHFYLCLSSKRGGARLSEFKVKLGDVFFLLGEVDRAKALWEEAIQLQEGLLQLPEHAEAQMRLSWLQAQEGAWEEARALAHSAQRTFLRYGEMERSTQIDELLSSIDKESKSTLPPFSSLFDNLNNWVS